MALRTDSDRGVGGCVGRLAVTVEEAARMLGVSRATLYKLVMHGEIDSFKVGNARRIAIAALEVYAGIRRSS
jgi:excisionase family DNA binding protein